MQKPAPIYGFTPGRMDVFWCAKDKSSVMQTWFDGSQWQTAIVGQSDVPFGPAPATHVNQPGKMDVGWTDAGGKLWYAKFDGGQWATPTELNPANMGGVSWVPSSGSIIGPPAYFASNSPLMACPYPSNGRAQNTEFLVCDSEKNICDLLFDNGTWNVSKWKLDDQMAFAPVQAVAQIGPGTTSPQPHIFWCDKDGKLRFSYTVSSDVTPGAAAYTCLNKFFETKTSPLFSAADFRGGQNPSGLLTILSVQPDPSTNTHPDPLSAYIWPLIRNQIPKNQYGRVSDQAGDALASEFNRLCGGPSLYDRARFAQVYLRKETRVLLAQNPQGGDDLRRLNRLLLEDGYDGQIARCLSYMGGVAFQPGVLAGLTPGRVDIFWTSLFRGAVMQTVWDGSNWSTNKIYEQYMPGGELVPVSGLSGGRIDLFCLSDDGSGKMNLDNIWWDGGGWSKATIAGGLSRGNPPAAIYNPAQGRLNVFWAGEDGKLWSMSSDGAAWTTPAVVGAGPMMRMPVLPAPEAIYGYRPGRMDVIYAGADKNVKQASGDGTKWNSVMLNPAEMVMAQGCQVSGDPPILSFLWLNAMGDVLYEWFDGNWHISKLVNNAGGKITAIGGSPSGQVFVVNDAGQLCKVDYRLGVGGSIRPADIDTPYPGYSGPYAPPTAFKQRFAPAVTDGVNIYLCDNDRLELCEVTEKWTDVNPVKTGGYKAQRVVGPMAYAPVAVGMEPWQLGHGTYYPGAFVFWCRNEDMSLALTWWGNYNIWQTIGIDPGPMATGPSKLLLPNGEVHLFWGAQDGTLKHMWAIRDQIGDPNHPDCWHTEVMDSVEMGSPPVALWNDAQGQIYVFWLDYDGQLKQTWLNVPNRNLPKWQTVTIAPATSQSMVWRDL